MRRCLLRKWAELAAVMVLIAACAAAGTGTAFAAARESGGTGTAREGGIVAAGTVRESGNTVYLETEYAQGKKDMYVFCE